MIDKNKQYTTRSGLPVRVYATDCGGDYPVHGWLLVGEHWISTCWTKEGKHSKPELNLIEVKSRIQRTEWFNVYGDRVGCGHRTREEADAEARIGRKACIQVPIDCEEGEGL